MKQSFLQEGYNQAEYEQNILAYLKQQQKGVTLADVVVGTGQKTEWTEYTLRQMLGKFPAHLEINDQQELVYLFDLTPKPLPVGKYILQGISWALWAVWWVFMLAFKIWMVGMLLTYGLVYALIIVIVIESITRSGDLFWEVCKGIWYGFGEVWKMLIGKNKSSLNENDYHFLSDIFSYVFGVSASKEDKLEIEKKILQQIRAQGGKLIPADIVRLTGWSLRDAQTQAAYLLANYQGEPIVTEAGKIEYHFPELVKENETSKAPAPIWEHGLPLPLMNYLDKDTHNTVTGLNIFNMVMAIVSPFVVLFMLPELNGDLPDWVLLWLTAVPFVFSAIFLGIPLCRYPFVQSQKAKVQRANERLFVLGEIFKSLPSPIDVAKDTAKISQTLSLPADRVKELLDKLQAEMSAEAIATPEGVQYHFGELG
jgi:hypothetical protein